MFAMGFAMDEARGVPAPADGRITAVDGYWHVIDGKAVGFERHMFDLSSGRDREALYRVARGIREGEACALADPGDGSGNYMAEKRAAGSLPAAVREGIANALAAGT